MKIPRISNPDEWVEIGHEDKADILVKWRGGTLKRTWTTNFIIEGMTNENFIFEEDIVGRVDTARFEADKEFLRKFDLDLTKAVFE